MMDSILGVAEWKYEFTFFDIIEEPFFAPILRKALRVAPVALCRETRPPQWLTASRLMRLCANLIHSWIQQR
ncbi:MAG: hypothetical protein QNJ36_05065, partial [Calothrix sp. MO_167.B42]|nr:hypothetical protein [Calothrix sp. MO_167.B42]